MQLYDFGVTSNPTALGMPVTSASINLESGKKVYEIALSKNGLTPNNYLGIVLTAPSVAIVKVYGKNGSNLYASGFSFKSIDNSTITTTGNGNDLYFAVFAVDKAIFNGIRFVANADTGAGKVSVFINDNASGKGKTALFLGETFLGRKEIDYPTQLQTAVKTKMMKDDLIYIDYEDDSSSAATKLQATAYFTFIDRPLNG